MGGGASSGGRRERITSILIASSGTLVEWYDFMVYAYLATLLAPQFFPAHDSVTSLLAAFGAFAVGFLGRPVGGVIFGNLGDKLGRKKTLLITVTMMTLPMVALSVVPTYAAIGIWAPVIVVLARFVQGIAVGGEYTGVITYLLEEAPRNRRALTANLGATVSANVGILCSSGVVTLTAWLLGEGAMHAYGWRIPFAIGACFALISLVMRRHMTESEEFERAKEEAPEVKLPVWEALRTHPKAILVAAALTGYLGISNYLILAFLPPYLTEVLLLPYDQAMLIGTVLAALMVILPPIAAWYSDRIKSRKKPLLASTLFLMVATYPLFVLLKTGNPVVVAVAAILLVIPLAVGTAAFVAAVAELFPTEQRYSALSVGYNFGNAALGGTAPLVGTALIAATHYDVAPAFYLIGASILILPVMFTIRETATLSMKELGK